MSVQTLNQQLAEQLGGNVTRGVVVTGVDPTSAAAFSGIRPGMVITEVNRKPTLHDNLVLHSSNCGAMLLDRWGQRSCSLEVRWWKPMFPTGLRCSTIFRGAEHVP